MLVGSAALYPPMARAPGVPLSTETAGELDFTGSYLNDAQISHLMGVEDVVHAFGGPDVITQAVRIGTAVPVRIAPEEYEVFRNSDGVM